MWCLLWGKSGGTSGYMGSVQMRDVMGVDHAQSVPMSSETRGAAIKARRLVLGIKSVNQFAGLSGVSREAITAAEAGSASTGTYDRLESWLDRFEEETGNDEPAEARNVVIELGEGRGRVVVRGPVEDLEKLSAEALRLFERGESH